MFLSAVSIGVSNVSPTPRPLVLWEVSSATDSYTVKVSLIYYPSDSDIIKPASRKSHMIWWKKSHAYLQWLLRLFQLLQAILNLMSQNKKHKLCFLFSTRRCVHVHASCVHKSCCPRGVTRPASTVPGWRLSALDRHRPPITAIGWCLDVCHSKNTVRKERKHETGVFPSLDRVSGTLCRSHYVTETSHLHSLRDFWRHFGLWRLRRICDCCFLRRVQIFLLTYLLLTLLLLK